MTKKTTYGELEKGFNGLDCLYNISKLVDKPGILIEEILQGVVNLIPHAWQDPEITCARLIFRDKEFRTENFKETNWRHAEDIRGYDKEIGALEVYYLKERPERDEAPFLKEERNLLTIIAKQLGHIIERKHSEEELLHFNAALRAIRGVNQLLAKEKESNRLVQGICDKLIDTRAYFSAWIALLDKAGGLVTIAESGLGEHFLPMTEMIKRGELSYCGQKAMNQSDVVVTQNPPLTCANCPLSDTYSGRGAMTMRLEREGKVYGLLSVSIPRDLMEDEKEKLLFKDVAGDICSALHSLELEEKRRQANEKLHRASNTLEKRVKKRTKELHRALYDTEEARDRIDGILKSIGDGLIVTDMYYRVILMNRAAEDLLGIRLSEVIDRPIDFAIRDKTIRKQLKAILDKKETGQQFEFEVPDENASQPRIIRARTSLIVGKIGTQKGIITMLYDVTLEREVDRMKTEFISIAAHELRTPLTSIQGFSEILLNRDDIKEQERKKFLSYINEQSKNLANIVDTLLDISRLESGRGLSLNKAPCNINEIIRETVSYFQISSPKNTFDITLPEESVELIVDKEKMRQVLENILTNAIKYSPEGGHIWVIGELTGEHYQVSVRDQGIGIAPDQIEKIFDKFYRVDVSNTGVPGIGLGMNIVKNLVEAHGGKVWAESELGKGTTVIFKVPI